MEKLKSIAEAGIGKQKALWVNGFVFATAMWLLSRSLILLAMWGIAPLLPAPPGGVVPSLGWGVFSWFDSGFYQQIATLGYDYANDGKAHSIAFFPLFPLLIRAVMSLGLPFEVAGTLVNNLAFLSALFVLYAWVEEHHGRGAARWATVVLAWCPLSLFGTVIYTEGLFLLLSTMALRSFEKQRYVGVAFWGTLATATRPTGMALIPAFLIVAWKERRPAIAYAASLAVGGGLLLFSLYCAFEFGDPLAFVQAQRKWRPSLGFDWLSWLKMLMQITVGPTNWKYGWIKDPLYPLLFSIILGCGFLLWRSRSKLGFVKVGDGFFVLGVLLWFLAGDPWIKAVTIFGGSYVLWRLRHSLSPVTVAFGFCALGLILASGSTISLNRLIYGIVSFSIAIGVLLERYPRWGYATLGFFTILLASFAVRFAQHQWVA